ncbi:hypothetical protein AcV7_003567 [Taiwanofungus camphoratus]|nr:hypothetical protein AcV7_003567 [Antrodia cinnamomea]
MATRCSSGSRSQPPALDARFIGLAVESRPAHTIMAYSKHEKPRGFAYGYTHHSTIVPPCHLSAVTNTLSEPLTSLSATLRLQSRTQCTVQPRRFLNCQLFLMSQYHSGLASWGDGSASASSSSSTRLLPINDTRSSENHGQMFSNYTFQYCPGLALHPRAHSRLL